MRLKGKVAMVTGASAGLGRATSLAYAREGAKLLLTDLNGSELNETALLSGLSQENYLTCVADVTKPEEINDTIVKGIEKFGHIDIQANIAGILIRKNLIESTFEDWQKVIDVNLTGIFNCVKSIAQIMIDQNHGKVINMGSIAGMNGYIYPSYCAAKAGVINITKSFMLELAPYNINVNSVSPGPIKTAITMPNMEEKYLAKIPQGRMGKAEDVASAFVFLASSDSSFINGATLVVDGGSISVYNFV